MIKFNSRLKKLYESLKSKGKVTIISGDELQDDEIDKEMNDFRLEYKRKQAQSIEEASKIFLNS